jgi:hypothetical protein
MTKQQFKKVYRQARQLNKSGARISNSIFKTIYSVTPRFCHTASNTLWDYNNYLNTHCDGILHNRHVNSNFNVRISRRKYVKIDFNRMISQLMIGEELCFL